MIQRKILLQNGWLHLPIGRDAQRRYVRFEAAGQPFAELYLGLSEKPDFYCGMELNRYLGQEIAVTIDEEAPGELLDGIQEGGAMDAGNPLYLYFIIWWCWKSNAQLNTKAVYAFSRKANDYACSGKG